MTPQTAPAMADRIKRSLSQGQRDQWGDQHQKNNGLIFIHQPLVMPSPLACAGPPDGSGSLRAGAGPAVNFQLPRGRFRRGIKVKNRQHPAFARVQDQF